MAWYGHGMHGTTTCDTTMRHRQPIYQNCVMHSSFDVMAKFIGENKSKKPTDEQNHSSVFAIRSGVCHSFKEQRASDLSVSHAQHTLLWFASITGTTLCKNRCYTCDRDDHTRNAWIMLLLSSEVSDYLVTDYDMIFVTSHDHILIPNFPPTVK